MEIDKEKKCKKFWENPPKIPGFSQNFLHKIPGDRFGAPKGPQGGAKGRDHVATGRDMVATKRPGTRLPASPLKKCCFPAKTSIILEKIFACKNFQ